MLRKVHAQPLSPLADALARVGDRWTLLVIDALMAGPRRFGSLAEDLAGIAPNVLADRLRRLEAGGLVLARPYSDRPRRLLYELTASGRELAGALRLLAEWGAREAGEGELLRHSPCGTPLETRPYCPTCGVTVADDEAVDVYLV